MDERIKDALKSLDDLIIPCLIREGNLPEADYHRPHDVGCAINEASRNLVEAFVEVGNGRTYLGKVNLYGNEKDGKPIWKHEGGTVYTFGADFVLPHFDALLEYMILGRANRTEYPGAAVDGKDIEVIHTRIEKLGGQLLYWC